MERDFRKERELEILAEIELKHTLLSDKEIENSVKKFKIANENTDLEMDFRC